MELWEMLGNVAAIFLILLIVLMTIAAVVTAVGIVTGMIIAMKDRKEEKQMDALPDKMMQQAAAGLKERDERNESM